jgi:hypothetical protein
MPGMNHSSDWHSETKPKYKFPNGGYLMFLRFSKTQPTIQDNLKQLLLGGIIIGKKNHTTTIM